jgi:iron complex outermembrane receptor protein
MKSIARGRRLSAGLAGAVTVAVACACYAQEAPAHQEAVPSPGKLSLEQLMQVPVSPFEVSLREDRGYQAFNSVTASRLSTPIRDLPFAIQVFNQAFIENQKPENIFDVARYSPSVTYRSNDFNEGNANIAIRGFAVGNEPGSIQLLRDGFHGPSIFDFTNVARLEIVKGPASFLYGQVAPGGVVNIITKTPQPVLAAGASIRYGSYGEYRFDSDVTGPIVPGLLFRVASSLEQDIHYWQPYDAHQADVAPSLVWRPNPSLTFTLKFEYFGKRETPQVMQKPGYSRQKGVVPTANDPNLSGVDVPGLADNWNSMSLVDYRNSDVASIEALADIKATERWDLRLGYAHQKYETDAVFSGNFGMSNNLPFTQGRRFRRQTYTNWDTTFQVDASGRYSLPFMSLRLLLGGQFIARRFDNPAGQAPNNPALVGGVASPLPDWDLRDPSTWNRTVLIPLSALTDNPTNQQTRYQDQAAYVGGTFGFLDDRLVVLAGVRVTQTVSRVINRLTNTAEPEFVGRKFTPQYGVLYKLPWALTLFATYAESFVPNSRVLLARSAATGGMPSQPTIGRGVDVGFKFQPWGGRLAGTLTFFDVRNRNILNDISELEATTGRQLFTTVQSGEQRSRGIEVDATLTPIVNWQTYLSYSYDDAKIIEFSGRDAAILAAGPSATGYKEVFVFHNAPLQMSAPHLANVWTRYEFMHGWRRGLYIGGGANLVFRQALLPDTPSANHQTYALYNVMVGYILRWFDLPATLEFYGKNLANAHYRPSQSTRSRPRELGGMLSVRF